MKVLHISTFDLAGGAARAANRLHQGLRLLGVQSRMLVAQRDSREPNIQAAPGPKTRIDVWRKRWRGWCEASAMRCYAASRPSGQEYFSTPVAEHPFGAKGFPGLPDVLHLHWVATLIDYATFFKSLPRELPLVWTLHDMNPFTGGCHYSNGCVQFKRMCGACPQLGSCDEMDMSRRNWEIKKTAFARRTAATSVVVAPSRWLAAEARSSSLLGDWRLEVIPYGLDTQVFCPKVPSLARAALGIPADAEVLLFVSDDLEGRRKGGDLLIEALRLLADRRSLFCMTLGRGRLELPPRVGHLPLGVCGSDPLLALVYSAADVFVLPSREDNLPNTVMEAMACGTPTVGFRIGGVPDMVQEGETGFLAEPFEPASLAEAIRQILDAADRAHRMREACRRKALAEYSLEVQARTYIRLYEELLAPS